MITFIASIISLILAASCFYVFLRSDLKRLLIYSSALLLLVLLNIIASLISVSFLLASIARSAFEAQIYTKFAIVLFRLGVVLLFIFLETVRHARYYLVKVFVVSTIFGISMATYHHVSFEFQKICGFWERKAPSMFGVINVVDLALSVFLLILMSISLFFTVRSSLKRIRGISKKRLVACHYYCDEMIILAGLTLFVFSRFLGPGVIINNVVILLSLTLILLNLTATILKYPYFLYVGRATLLGVMIISLESGVLIYEEGPVSGGLFVSGAFWTIVKIMEERLRRKPYIISFIDSHVIINYVGPIIGVYLFDNYFDELKVFSRFVSETIAEDLRRHGLIGGLFIEDDEIKQEIIQIIRRTLDPFIP